MVNIPSKVADEAVDDDLHKDPLVQDQKLVSKIDIACLRSLGGENRRAIDLVLESVEERKIADIEGEGTGITEHTRAISASLLEDLGELNLADLDEEVLKRVEIERSLLGDLLASAQEVAA